MFRVHARYLMTTLAALCFLGCGGGGGSPPADQPPISTDIPPLYRFTEPREAVTFTNGNLSVALGKEGGPADRIELLADERVIAELRESAYQWNTSTVPEGIYTLRIRAYRGSEVITMSDTRTVHVDRTAPQVELTPTPGTQTVRNGAPMVVRFSEPVQPIYKAEVLVRYTPTSGLQVTRSPDTLTLSEDRRTLTLEMTGSFAPDSNWSVEITRIEDDARNVATLAPGAWSWRVPAWLRVGAPLSALAGATDASLPKLAMDAEGAWVAWEEGGKVHTRRWSGSTWEERGSLPETGSGASPALVMGAVGTPYLALTDASGATPTLRVFRWSGSDWLEVGSGPAVASGANPSLALDGSEAPVLVAEGHDGTAVSIHAWRYTQAEGWVAMAGSPMSAKTGSSHAARPTVVFDASGTGWVSFAEADATRSDVYLREWTGSTWSAVGDALSSQPAWHPSLVAHAAEGVVAGFITDGQVQTLHCYSGSCPSGKVLANQGLHPWVDRTGGFVLAVDDGAGNGHVEVLDANGSPVWSALPERDGPLEALQPHVSSTNSAFFLAWSRPNGDARDVYVYRYNN